MESSKKKKQQQQQQQQKQNQGDFALIYLSADCEMIVGAPPLREFIGAQ